MKVKRLVTAAVIALAAILPNVFLDWRAIVPRPVAKAVAAD